jgi:hypothetical protein
MQPAEAVVAAVRVDHAHHHVSFASSMILSTSRATTKLSRGLLCHLVGVGLLIGGEFSDWYYKSHQT